MKISTWNVNSLGVRLPQVLDWLATSETDILAIQETKTVNEKFPVEELKAAGFHCVFHGQKTYNGVAILSRYPLCDVIQNIPVLQDDQARVITVTASMPEKDIRIMNAYFVNGQAPDTEKFAYKMRWLQALTDFVREEKARHENFILLGDFNVTPDDRDTFDPVGLRGSIHHTPQERAHFQDLLELGLVDAFRLFEQPEKSFSWWDYRMLGFQKNRGLRIDHILLSSALARSCTACTIDRQPRKNKQPSDHAPVIVNLEF